MIDSCSTDVNIIMLGAIMVGVITGVMLCYFNCFAPIIQHIKKCQEKNNNVRD